MSKGIFITGTDTGVGKTIVSAAIIRALIKKGIKVGAMKPIETGCTKTEDRRQKTEDRLLPSDGMFLKEMAEMDDPIDLVVPIRFEQPLAPMVASDLEEKPVKVETIFSAYKLLSKKYDFMVVEGAGGLLVPVMRQAWSGKRMTLDVRFSTHGSRRTTPRSWVYFVADLIKDLELSVIVVARPTLGTINHTLLTVNHALREGINMRGVIINYNTPPTGDIAEKTNPDVLKELCPVPVIGTFPYIKEINKYAIDNAAQMILNPMTEAIQKIFTLP